MHTYLVVRDLVPFEGITFEKLAGGSSSVPDVVVGFGKGKMQIDPRFR